MDTCIRKPLVATCGLDKSVRIWNYVDKTLELYKYFNEEAHSVAFHPSGLHVLAGFSDKLDLRELATGQQRLSERAVRLVRRQQLTGHCAVRHGSQ